MPEPPLERDEFVKALHAQKHRYWREHPFHTRLHQGKLSDHEIRTWVANRWYYQAALPRKDAAILANCPLPEVRRRWIIRIVYQDGPREREGGLEAWLRLAEAVGLTRSEVIAERHVAPGARFATDAYLTFARERPWIEAVAASLTELFSPDLMRDRVLAMRHHYRGSTRLAMRTSSPAPAPRSATRKWAWSWCFRTAAPEPSRTPPWLRWPSNVMCSGPFWMASSARHRISPGT